MTKKKVYVAGPMLGFAEFNFPAFDAASRELRRKGWWVFNPAEMDRATGIDEFTDPLPPDFLRHAMRRDLAAICECDAIYLLRGWEKSSGAGVELTLARFLKLEILLEAEGDVPTTCGRCPHVAIHEAS